MKVKSGEHIAISLLTFNKTKSSKESPIHDYLAIISRFLRSLTSILTNGINKFELEIKESLLIKQYKPISNKNISSAKLFLLDNC